MEQIGAWLDSIVSNPEDAALQAKVAEEVRALCNRFPAPGLEHLV